MIDLRHISRHARRARPGTRGALWLLAICAAALVPGCGGGSGGPTPEQIVSQSAVKTSGLHSFHLVVDIEHVPAPASGLGLTFVDGDVLVPARMSARVGGTFQGIPLTSRFVIVGDRHYLQNPFSRKWQLIQVALTPVAFFDPSKGVLAVIKGARETSLHGKEDVAGIPCYRLTAKVPAAAIGPLLTVKPVAALVPVELWIGERDLLLRKVRLSGAIAAGEGKDAVRTIELSRFDAPVRIEAPAVASS